MAKDEHTGRKLAIGATLAGAIGYITGILTAPKSGKETREDIADKAEELKESAEEQLQNAHDELTELIKTAKSKSMALGSKARAEFNEADDPALNKAIKQVKQAQKNLGKYLKS